MDDLVAFLTARLDEREQAAQKAKAASQSGAWWLDIEEGDAETGTRWALIGIDRYFAQASKSAPTDPLKHIELNNPDAALADIAAKRKIVELHRSRTVSVSEHEMFDPNVLACSSCSKPDVVFADEYQPYPCPTLRLLAEPFAWHPDYREEWKP